MISRIRGTLLRRELELVEVLTAGGVAYEIDIPLSVYERLPREGEEVELRTHQVVREDAITLFGFLEERERALFATLLTASGVGPRLALGLLSHLGADGLVRAVGERNVAALRQVPGVGRKTAERLVLELADKLDDLALLASTGARPGAVPTGRAAEEAVSALVALGFAHGQAVAAVRRALDEQGGLEGGDLIKAALASAGN